MHYRLHLPLLLFTAVAAFAGPLNRKHVAVDAKWVLHLDADAFRTTKIGAYFLAELLDPKSAQGKADLKRELDFDLDWRKVQSATLYGRTFVPPGQEDPTGVLLLTTTMAVQPALERAMARQIPGFQIQKLDSPAAPLYTLNDKGYIAFAPGGVIVLGKSQSAVEQGCHVLGGTSSSLAGSTALSGYPQGDASQGFFLLAVAEGFADQAAQIPKAEMLRNALGAQLVAREANEQLHLNLSIRTTSADVAQQIQQVVQGLVALAQLQGNQNPDLQAMAQGASVSATDSTVTLGASMKVADVLRKIDEKK